MKTYHISEDDVQNKFILKKYKSGNAKLYLNGTYWPAPFRGKIAAELTDCGNFVIIEVEGKIIQLTYSGARDLMLLLWGTDTGDISMVRINTGKVSKK